MMSGRRSIPIKDAKLGQVWLPNSKVTLGAEAGAAMAQIFFEWDTDERFTPLRERDPATYPLLEISKLFLHKLGGIKKVLNLLAESKRAELVGILEKSSKRLDKPIRDIVYFMKTPLP